MACQDCKNMQELKCPGDEAPWFKCKLTGTQLYNSERYVEIPDNCPIKKEED